MFPTERSAIPKESSSGTVLRQAIPASLPMLLALAAPLPAPAAFRSPNPSRAGIFYPGHWSVVTHTESAGVSLSPPNEQRNPKMFRGDLFPAIPGPMVVRHPRSGRPGFFAPASRLAKPIRESRGRL